MSIYVTGEPQGTHNSHRFSFVIEQEPHCPCAVHHIHRLLSSNPPTIPFTSSGIRDPRYLPIHHAFHAKTSLFGKIHHAVKAQDQIWPRSKIRIEILHLHACVTSDPSKQWKVRLRFVCSFDTISGYFTHARYAWHLPRAAHVFG